MFRHGWAGEKARSELPWWAAMYCSCRDQVGVGVGDRPVRGADRAVGHAQHRHVAAGDVDVLDVGHIEQCLDPPQAPHDRALDRRAPPRPRPRGPAAARRRSIRRRASASSSLLDPGPHQLPLIGRVQLLPAAAHPPAAPPPSRGSGAPDRGPAARRRRGSVDRARHAAPAIDSTSWITHRRPGGLALQGATGEAARRAGAVAPHRGRPRVVGAARPAAAARIPGRSRPPCRAGPRRRPAAPTRALPGRPPPVLSRSAAARAVARTARSDEPVTSTSTSQAASNGSGAVAEHEPTAVDHDVGARQGRNSSPSRAHGTLAA